MGPGMSCAEEADRVADVAIVDDAIPDHGWHSLDLTPARRLTGSARPSDATAATTTTVAAWSGQAAFTPPGAMILSFSGATPGTMTPARASDLDRGLGRPVPVSAFVSIGRMAGTAEVSGTIPLRRARSASANDNVAAFGAASGKSIWRELFFLAVLVATLAGAFWTGRVHGFQKIIVVPGPSSFYSVVT